MQIPDEQIPTIIRALEHSADYLKATNRDDRLYRDLAESLKHKPAEMREGRRVPPRRRRA